MIMTWNMIMGYDHVVEAMGYGHVDDVVTWLCSGGYGIWSCR